MTKSAIEIIHDAARNAPSGSLDRQIYLDNTISLYGFADTSAKQKVYVDVPVNKVVALSRNDFWLKGETWRNVTLHLHGRDWSHDIFNYFTEPLEEQPFPASGSLYELRLMCVGGVCECGNGNHRLVAGRAWLTEKFRENALFKSAKVSSYPVHPALIDFLKNAVIRGTGVRTANINWTQRLYLTVDGKKINLLFSTTDAPNTMFAWTQDGLVSLNDDRTIFQRFFPSFFKQPYQEYQWKEIPLEIVKEMMDDSWITSQIEKAKRYK